MGYIVEVGESVGGTCEVGLSNGSNLSSLQENVVDG